MLERQWAADPRSSEKTFRAYLSEPRHWNKYAYVLNNPLGSVDPDGKQDEKITQLVIDLTTALTEFSTSPTPAIVPRLVAAITKSTLTFAFGPNLEVVPGGLASHEVSFANEVSQFTQNSFVGVPQKEEPGIDGILTGSGGFTDVKGVASLTETGRSNPRVLLDKAEDKEESAQKGGYKHVDLFIKATSIDSTTALEYVNRGTGFTNITSGQIIRSINIFTSDNKVVRITGTEAKVCDNKGKCQ